MPTRPPDRAARAVAREQPPARDLASPSHPCAPPTGCRRRPARRAPLVAVPHGHADRGQLVAQLRLQSVLRQVAQRCRRDRQHVVALALEGQAAEHLAAEAGDPVDRAGVARVLGEGEERVDVDPDLAPDLEGPRVHHVGRRRPLRAVAATRRSRPLSPRRAARNAAVSPTGPAPTTSTSTSVATLGRVDRARSERPGVGAAVEVQVLAADVPGLRAAQERARVAELGRAAEPLGRDRSGRSPRRPRRA